MTQEQVLTVLKKNEIKGTTYYDMLGNVLDNYSYVREHFGGVEALISNAYTIYKTDDCSFCFAIVCGAQGFARDLILDMDWNLSWSYKDGIELLSDICEVLKQIYHDAKGKGLDVEADPWYDEEDDED